ncbi:hypothetical protein DYH09_30860 [bacterium CPR1]|nr:hypothetical protein [bacterium CPR1]
MPSGDTVELARLTPEKEEAIRSMIRRAPDEFSRERVVEALAAYPLEALVRVQAYGTRIEVYDLAGGDAVPSYLPTLSNPDTLGAYNTKANVLGFDRSNLTPFAVLHEFAHALDMSMGEPSRTPEWRGAHALAANTNQAVRDYAKQDPSEYLAESVAAYLIPDQALVPLIERGLAEERGLGGLDERQYWQMHQNFCRGRLERVDGEGYRLVRELLGQDEVPAVAPLPAMSEAQWNEFMLSSPPSEGH